MADSKLPALTEVSVPALDDPLYLVDISDTTDDATGSSRKVTNTRLLGLLNHVCQGRLTLESGVPVSTSDQTAKTSVYFTPYNGNRIAIYDGTRWRLYTFTELTLALGTLTSGKNYDVFIYDNAGTLTLELSAAWTSDTARNDALTTQDGVYVKSGATTRRYLGTIRTTSTTTTEDSAGGTTTQVGGKLFVWNLYNQVPRRMFVKDTADAWNYETNTYRIANGASAPSNCVEYVTGDAATKVLAVFRSTVALISNATNRAKVGVGVDSSSAFSGTAEGGYNANAGYVISALGATYSGQPGLGYHYLSMLEAGSSGGGANDCQFTGDNAGDSQTGLYVELMG